MVSRNLFGRSALFLLTLCCWFDCLGRLLLVALSLTLQLCRACLVDLARALGVRLDDDDDNDGDNNSQRRGASDGTTVCVVVCNRNRGRDRNAAADRNNSKQEMSKAGLVRLEHEQEPSLGSARAASRGNVRSAVYQRGLHCSSVDPMALVSVK